MKRPDTEWSVELEALSLNDGIVILETACFPHTSNNIPGSRPLRGIRKATIEQKKQVGALFEDGDKK
jgi:hypothetical protein